MISLYTFFNQTIKSVNKFFFSVHTSLISLNARRVTIACFNTAQKDKMNKHNQSRRWRLFSRAIIQEFRVHLYVLSWIFFKMSFILPHKRSPIFYSFNFISKSKHWDKFQVSVFQVKSWTNVSSMTIFKSQFSHEIVVTLIIFFWNQS